MNKLLHAAFYGGVSYLTLVSTRLCYFDMTAWMKSSNVQQFLARELRALLDELEARLRLGAHQAFDRACGRRAVSSTIVTRSSVRFRGSMVVSLSCAAIISPSPLKRPISTLALA